MECIQFLLPWFILKDIWMVQRTLEDDNQDPSSLTVHDYLDGLKTVAVVAEDPGELHLPDLGQLVRAEGGGPAGVLIPEPVTELQVVECSAHHTGECGAHHGPGQRGLSDTSGPEIYVSRTLV